METKVNQNIIGLNLDSITWQVKENQVTWALNANVQGMDGDSITYTNEPGNTSCYNFTEGELAGFKVVGFTNIVEQSKVILFLTHPDGRSRIGQITAINNACLDIEITEKDCGCKEGTIITENTVFEDLPEPTVSLECPDGFTYNPTTKKCEQVAYRALNTELPGVPVIETCIDGGPCGVVSTHGCLYPRVYGDTWTTLTPNSYSSVYTSLSQSFWVPNGSGVFNVPTYVKDIAVQADLNPSGGSCRTCHTVAHDFIGFTETVCIPETKKYFLGVAADESLRITVDGVVILDIQAGTSPSESAKRLYSTYPINPAENGFIMWSAFHIFPVEFTAGSHLIKFEYKNSLGIGMFAYELYDITLAELTSPSLTKATLQSKRVISNGQPISSQPKRPTTANPPGLGGLFTELTSACPEGYTLVADENCLVRCKGIITQNQIEITSEPTCCKYEDLVVDDCLDSCEDNCYEYVVGYTASGIAVTDPTTGEVIVVGDPLSTVQKTFSYTDCEGNYVEDFILATNKRFKAKKGTLDLNHPRLVVIQEVLVTGQTQTFSKDNCCLNFDIAFPVNAEYRIDECETKIYYISRNNPPRYFSVEYPYGRDACGEARTCIKESCEDSKIFADFCIPEVHVTDVNDGGQLKAGVYSFAIAYADEQGIELTEYCDLTNPIPIYERAITEQTEYVTSKSVNLKVFHKTKIFEYFNVVVAETINTTTTYHLVGTYRVNQYSDTDQVIYTGDYKSSFSSIVPIIRGPHYETANIIEKQNDILMLADLEEAPKYNFQPFASKINLLWETVQMPADGQFDYSSPEVAYFFRTYQRDEVYAFGIKFRLKNGKYTDVFHIPGRKATSNDLILEQAASNPDVFVGESDCIFPSELPRWQVYNTASAGVPISKDEDLSDEIEKQYNCAIKNHKQGQFAYWESTEVYPCYDEIWGQSTDPNAPYYDPNALAGKPIRHHKFPDSAKVHIHDKQMAHDGEIDHTVTNDYNSTIYPIGVRIDEAALTSLLNQKKADGTYAYTVYDPIKKTNVPIKDVICGYELVHATRVGNKSVIAKGLLYDVGVFEDNSGDGPIKKYYYPNYPYNDLFADPYLMNDSRWYQESEKVLEEDGSTGVGGVGGFANVPIIGNNRYTFYSPDTSFQYPKIGTELKLETIEFGKVLGHFMPVAEHPRYRFLKKQAFIDAGTLASLISFEQKSETEADISVTVGGRNRSAFTARIDKLFTNEQLFLDIAEKLIPFVNFAYQYNSIATYNQYVAIDPLNLPSIHRGKSRRFIDLGYYANDRIVQVFDDAPLHNRLRETSVYLKLRDYLPLHSTQIIDNSRYLASNHASSNPQDLTEDRLTRAYYSSVKRQFPNQYGPLENLRYVSTGYRQDLIRHSGGSVSLSYKYYPAFGGDTYITPFAIKRKHSFFTRNLVNLPAKADEMPFDYWLFPNLGYPKFFIGTSSNMDSLNSGDIAAFITGIAAAVAATYAINSSGGLTGVWNYVSQIVTNYVFMNGAAPFITLGVNAIWSKFVKKTSLDKAENTRYHKDGIFYTASYGIPIFFVESDVNLHFRHGRDLDKENFYPNVGGGVPDEWLQEATVPIKFDNYYHYNATYSIQNMSPNQPYRLKYPNLECIINHQNRVIYSDQASDSNLTSDKWLSFRPGNFYDFPKQGGRLIDLNAGESERVYARFENTTKVYNARIVLSSTSPYQLEIGNADMFKQKPVDLSTTDLGYIGSQHKAYVRTEYGTFWVDAKRGHIYQITGQGFNEIKSELNYNWFKENLPFQILKDFPEADVDVPSLGIGIVMGWDERFERIFITKLDYRVRLQYRTGTTKVEYITDRLDPDYRYYVLNTNGVRTRIDFSQKEYFENKSWTVAYSPKLKNFISFYSFLPNFFIPQLGHFQTIITTPLGSSLWNHNLSPYIYQTYYGKLYPYIIEYLVNSLPANSILNSVSLVQDIQEYYSKYEYYSLGTTNNKNVANFTKAIVYNREQSSGIINLIPEIFGNTRQKLMYPKVTPQGIDTIISRRENKYTFNGFWNLAAQANGQPLWTTKWEDLQADYFIDKMPNVKAVRNVGVAFQKNKIKADFTKVRLIQDKYNRYKFVNNLQINQLNTTSL